MQTPMDHIVKDLPDYKILKKLGSGGSGMVYKAIHLPTQETVAIKVLNEKGNPLRYKNEARLQASVDHPRIAKLHDFLYINGRFFLIMEYISGITLNDLIERSHSISYEKKIKIFTEIVDAVAYLHQRQIIHRDLKPANIKIMADGHVKLIDFGISKGLSTPALTQEGFIIGTLNYAAPERLQGESYVQSDIWSLGVMYYELLSGNKFLNANTTEEIVRRIKSKTYILTVLSEVAKKEAGIIKKCLQKVPTQRYRNATELLKAIQKTRASKVFQIPNIGSAFSYSKFAISGLFILCILLSAYILWPEASSAPASIKDPTSIKIILHPSDAEMLYDGKTYRSGDAIISEKGSTGSAKLTAEGYFDKEVLITHSTYKEEIVLEYSLNKR